MVDPSHLGLQPGAATASLGRGMRDRGERWPQVLANGRGDSSKDQLGSLFCFSL